MNQPPVPLDIVNPTVVVTTLPAALDPLPVGNALLPGQVGVVGADVPVEILLLGTALPDVLRTDGALVGTRVVVFVFAVWLVEDGCVSPLAFHNNRGG